jgi:peptide/nickel transport system substrate-binding protein
MSNNPNGFEFTFAYSTTPMLSVNPGLLAQKLQSDLAKINIKMNLAPMDQSSLVTQYRTAKLQSGVISYTIDALDANLWTRPFVTRIAKRMHWEPPKDFVSLVDMAAVEPNVVRRNEMYEQYQKNMVNEATFINIVQPALKIATNKQLKNVNLTAAGWYINLKDVKR